MLDILYKLPEVENVIFSILFYSKSFDFQNVIKWLWSVYIIKMQYKVKGQKTTTNQLTSRQKHAKMYRSNMNDM